MVYDRQDFSRVDLRVEHHKEPVGELRRILDIYKPLIPYYTNRPSDPTHGATLEWLGKNVGEEAVERYLHDT